MSLRILEWDRLDAAGRRAALARPTLESSAEVLASTRAIVEDVRRDGDDALRRLTERFDGVRLDEFAVTRAELDAARRLVESRCRSLRSSAQSPTSRLFMPRSCRNPLSMETMPGVRCESVVRPIESVGLYVPAGSAPLPSAVIMLAIPARIAGCPRRVLCTPPGKDGKANAAVLLAAQLCGIEEVFKVGGAQAIAALAYGTQSVPKVDKLFGPGNAWVTAAKQLVAHDAGGAACDMPAGPSEVMVIADDTAPPDFVAADLLAQAEHDPQAQAILLTSSALLRARWSRKSNARQPRFPAAPFWRNH